jgi:hypothetical protein
MECQQSKNLKNCSCTYPGCPRKGICCECLEYHRIKDELPACYFSKTAESGFDRSIENFIKNRK